MGKVEHGAGGATSRLVYLPGKAEPRPLPEILTPGVVLGAFWGLRLGGFFHAQVIRAIDVKPAEVRAAFPRLWESSFCQDGENGSEPHLVCFS